VAMQPAYVCFLFLNFSILQTCAACTCCCSPLPTAWHAFNMGAAPPSVTSPMQVMYMHK
jgi:hypothetical protein